MPAPPRPCPVCGATARQPLLDRRIRSPFGETYGVVVCTACGLGFTDPVPTSAEMDAMYESSYYKFAYDPRSPSWHPDDTAARRRTIGSRAIDALTFLFKRALLLDRERALSGRPPGRVLDLGCGNGDFLRHLRRLGWEVQGLEVSAEAAGLARAKGIPVHRGDLGSASYPDRSFDVVTLWHVVEHLPRPLPELAEVRRILRDDGLLVVEVPNSDCLTFRLCGTAWRQLDVPRHLQHFTRGTLERALADTGFATVRRQDLHATDFDLAFYSFMDRLGVTGRTGIRYFSTDFLPAPLRSKALFLAVGIPLALVAVPYTVAATFATGNGESVTLTARKTPA